MEVYFGEAIHSIEGCTLLWCIIRLGMAVNAGTMAVIFNPQNQKLAVYVNRSHCKYQWNNPVHVNNLAARSVRMHWISV